MHQNDTITSIWREFRGRRMESEERMSARIRQLFIYFELFVGFFVCRFGMRHAVLQLERDYTH